jgi:integrase
VWSADQITAFMDAAYPEMQHALMLALYTAARQGDLIRLSWNNYDGRSIIYRPAKTRRRNRVEVPLPAFLCRIFNDMKREKKRTTILAERKGAPWREDNFRHEWIRICAAAGIDDLHWHDLRGTTVTLLWEEGCNDAQIAAITGHSLKSVAEILNRYTGRTKALAEQAAARLERRLSGVFAERILQNALQNGAVGKNENTQ